MGFRMTGRQIWQNNTHIKKNKYSLLHLHFCCGHLDRILEKRSKWVIWHACYKAIERDHRPHEITPKLSLCGEKYPNRRRYEWRILSSLSSVVLVLNLMSISVFWEPDGPSSSFQTKIDFSRQLEGWLVAVLKHAKTHQIQHNNHTG